MRALACAMTLLLQLGAVFAADGLDGLGARRAGPSSASRVDAEHLPAQDASDRSCDEALLQAEQDDDEDDGGEDAAQAPAGPRVQGPRDYRALAMPIERVETLELRLPPERPPCA